MLKNFIANESGAVTVDWVVLTAALVGLGLAVMGVVSSGVQTASNNIAAQLNTDMIGSGFATSSSTVDNGDGTSTTTVTNTGLDTGTGQGSNGGTTSTTTNN